MSLASLSPFLKDGYNHDSRGQLKATWLKVRLWTKDSCYICPNSVSTWILLIRRLYTRRASLELSATQWCIPFSFLQPNHSKVSNSGSSGYGSQTLQITLQTHLHLIFCDPKSKNTKYKKEKILDTIFPTQPHIIREHDLSLNNKPMQPVGRYHHPHLMDVDMSLRQLAGRRPQLVDSRTRPGFCSNESLQQKRIPTRALSFRSLSSKSRPTLIYRQRPKAHSFRSCKLNYLNGSDR